MEQNTQAPTEGADAAGDVETKAYADGTTATGTPPLPEQSPDEQPLVAEEGGTVLFYDKATDPATVARIVRVWNPGCVNLDNGKCSVPVIAIGAPKPAAYFCELFEDDRSPEEREVAFRPRTVGLVKPAPSPGELAIFHRVEVARTLPEVPTDADTIEFGREPDLIEQFKDEDRRTMRIVMTDDGYAKQPVVPAKD